MNEERYREVERRLWESVGVTPTEQRVHLVRTGATVRVQEVGEGPAVLFVHGASIGGSSWAPLVSRLQGFRCLVLDRPGCGLSDPLDTAFKDVDGLAAFADALIADLLDALGVGAAHIVATSFGGWFALRTAVAHPERIGSFVEFCCPVGAPGCRPPMLMRLANAPALGRLLAAVPPTERAVRAMFRQIGLSQALQAGRISQELLEWFVALLRDTDTMRNEIRALPRLMYLLRGLDERMVLPAELLAAIHTPVLFLWGEQDPMGGTEIARAFVELLPNAELELLPGTGHAAWIDDPNHAADVTRRFLARRSLDPLA